MMLSMEVITAGLAEQLYEDCKIVASMTPDERVDEELVQMYNQVLDSARKSFPVYVKMGGFTDMAPSSMNYRSALFVTGQLSRMLSLLTYDEAAAAQAEAMQNSSGGRESGLYQKPAEQPSNGEDNQRISGVQNYYADPEFYDNVSPHHLNEDGTVRFSLED